MIDIKLLRESPEEITNKLLTRGYELNISDLTKSNKIDWILNHNIKQ